MLRVHPNGSMPLSRTEEANLATIIDLGTETVEGFGELFKGSQLLDLVVKVGDKEFKAHKAYLAAVSVEFRRMISEAKAEEGTPHTIIEAESISPAGMKMVMDFLYEQNLELTLENLELLLQTSTHFNIECLVAKCCNFMMNALSKETFVQILVLANKYSLIDVHQEVLEFISEFWISLPESLIHLPKDDLLTVLDSVSQCESEVEIFSMAKRWLEADPERLSLAGDVMTTIKFPLMTESELDDITESTPFLLQEPCAKLIQEARDYHHMPASAKVLQTNKRTKVRGDPCHIALFTGLTPSVPSNDFFVPYVLDVSSNFQYRWISMPSVPESLGGASVMAINNFLVACGVGTITDSTEDAFASCAIFDPRNHGWSPISSMSNPRIDFPLVTVGDTLYAIGGSGKWKSTAPIASVEAYSFKEDRWFDVAPLPERLASAAACEYLGKIYISGGIREDKSVSQNMWAYDPKTDEWSEMPKLLQTEQGHAMIPLLEGQLTLVSAESSKINTFSFETNQWSELLLNEWSKELCERATIIHYTPKQSLIAWQKLEPKSDVNEAAAGDSNLKVEICHQPLQFIGEGMMKTRWYTTRVLDFPDGVIWRHCALLTLPWRTLCQGKLECHPAEEDQMMVQILRHITRSYEAAELAQD